MYRDKNGIVKDSFHAYLVEGAEFTEIEEYPIIRKNMVPYWLPEKVMPFSKAITCHKDLKDYVIYFYSEDETFERIRKNPKRYLKFFKRCKGIIGFDFSIHTDMPIVKQKSQINDNISLSYFYGNNGIPVFPNCRCGVDSLNEEFFTALPKNSYIAIGVHGFIKRKNQKYEWQLWIGQIIKAIKPKGIIVIGHLPNNIKKNYENEVSFYEYDSYIEMRKKGDNNGD